jgi:hypothetical protein
MRSSASGDECVRQVNEQSATQQYEKYCERQVKTRTRARVHNFAVNGFRGHEKPRGCDRDNRDSENNQRKSRIVSESLPWHREAAPSQRRGRKLQKQVESFHKETEGHDGYGRAHPGEKSTLVCGMIRKIPNHLKATAVTTLGL